MIDLIPSDEQQQLTDALADFLAGALPVERLRGEGQATERNPALWAGLAEIGAFAISAPEQCGGLGLTLAEEVLAFREYGRFLLSPAVLGTVVAIRIAVEAGDHALAKDLVAGRQRAGIGLVTPNSVQLFEVGDDDLVVTWDERGASLFEAHAFCDVAPQTCTDNMLQMGLAARVPDKAPLHVTSDVRHIPAIATILLAAMLTGMIEAIRDQAVAFAKDRHQFGRPIGSFQAIKHRCADIACRAEAAWCQTVYAALAQVEGTADMAFHAANAKLIAGTYALDAARVNIQLHGGIGFTAEIDAHRYLKRIHVLNELGGNLRSLQHRLNTLSSAA